jgi:hypothetical protein
MDNIDHNGWLDVPGESDFDSCWGIIGLDEIEDCRQNCKTFLEAKFRTHSAGKRWLLFTPSKRGNILYKIDPNGGTHKCVYAMLDYHARNKEKWHDLYHNDLRMRVRQIVASIRQRSKKRGQAFDLCLDDIFMRISNGLCEATGIALDLENIGSAFGPSIDQIEPGGGYTQDNVMVVAMIYNSMKQDYTSEQVCHFVEHLQSLPSPKTWLTRSREINNMEPKSESALTG